MKRLKVSDFCLERENLELLKGVPIADLMEGPVMSQ